MAAFLRRRSLNRGSPSTIVSAFLDSLLTTRGQIIRRGSSAPEALALGASGTLLRSDGTDAGWATVAASLDSLLTTRGDIIRRGSTTTERLAIGATSGQVLQSDGTDASWGDIVDGGTYTPSLSNAANLSASTAYTCPYLRIANVCFVAGKFDADAVAAASTTTTLGISLPVASNFTNESNAGGTSICHSPSQSCRVVADATNDRLNVNWLSLSTANLGFSFIAGYIIQ